MASGLYLCSCRLGMVRMQLSSVSKRKTWFAWLETNTLFSEAVGKTLMLRVLGK